ncbi:MAG: SWIM zinc finger domain-containing protein [Bifidobacteriaceae bacterium]|jgi:hypothetical protein|nr:SWIM zinc finger domain-containing protein [Bifidobacteriaceae bacterium]
MTAAPGLEQAYRYLGESCATVGEGGAALALATSGGVEVLDGEVAPAAHPFFFAGFVSPADVFAQALLLVAQVARTRFYKPPGMVGAMLAAADPVVTVTPGRVRFESFSACCGVAARLDLLPEAFDAQRAGAGTTNVDLNPPARALLAQVGAGAPLRLQVGAEELSLATMGAALVERKVPLATRWVRGFGEAQAQAARMSPLFAMSPAEARAFVRALPRASATKAVSWAVPSTRGFRLAPEPRTGPAACLAGPERLRFMEPLLRHGIGLRVYGAGQTEPGASAWELGLPGMRLTATLSPDKSRGFSGEGGLLGDLAHPGAIGDADLVAALLAYEPAIDLAALSAAAGWPCDAQRTGRALNVLAAAGRIGYDLADQAYYHRELPYDAALPGALAPRLDGARALAAGGAVTWADPAHATVAGQGGVYLVALGADLSEATCTCPWYGRHHGARGPCKHVLAATLARPGAAA